MVAKFLKFLLLLSALCTAGAQAGPYISLAPALIQIKTDAGKTKPLMTDIRLGYALDGHSIEFAAMTRISDDDLNQLTTDIPLSTSIFYRYTGNVKSSLNVAFILGYSQTEVEAAYIQPPNFSETFQGVSFGVGFEEALRSIPQLKIKFDLIRLYQGDQLDIDTISLGVRYEF
ncbi:hypothetical protein MNBD_GAMMA11-3463 [hydrothermal vent metagenome]|uniref:Outer membrane protein beta-barrel domain-containing protein n=1 Tax=hydrothermal vent metagenome TaxID=652676 RepID=A0A3B0XNY9_9ZZZZ